MSNSENNIIETDTNKNIKSKLLHKIDRVLSKFTILPTKESFLNDVSKHHTINNESICDNDDNSNIAIAKIDSNLNFDLNVYMKCFVHELRTPLSTISLGLSLLEKKIKDEENTNIINDLIKSVSFIEETCSNFVVIQDGNIKLNPFEKLSIEKIIKKVKTLLIYYFEESNTEFEYNIDEKINNLYYGDLHNILHVIINLLKNAIKYQVKDRKNKIIVNVSRLEEKLTPRPPDSPRTSNTHYLLHKISREKHTILFSIIDTNNHLPKHIKEHLFETFNSTSGSGLGLYICKNIIELHGGSITHESIEPEGNVFNIIIPLEPCNNEVVDIEESSKRIQQVSGKLIKYNILIVDDSELNRKILYKIFKTLNIINDIFVAEDGVKALEVFKGNKIDIILLDKNMPNMCGMKLSKALRELNYNKLIIGVTGISDKNEIKEFLNAGVDFVFVKPFNPDKINILMNFIKEYGVTRHINMQIKLIDNKLHWINTIL